MCSICCFTLDSSLMRKPVGAMIFHLHWRDVLLSIFSMPVWPVNSICSTSPSAHSLKVSTEYQFISVTLAVCSHMASGAMWTEGAWTNIPFRISLVSLTTPLQRWISWSSSYTLLMKYKPNSKLTQDSQSCFIDMLAWKKEACYASKTAIKSPFLSMETEQLFQLWSKQ